MQGEVPQLIGKTIAACSQGRDFRHWEAFPLTGSGHWGSDFTEAVGRTWTEIDGLRFDGPLAMKTLQMQCARNVVDRVILHPLEDLWWSTERRSRSRHPISRRAETSFPEASSPDFSLGCAGQVLHQDPCKRIAAVAAAVAAVVAVAVALRAGAGRCAECSHCTGCSVFLLFPFSIAPPLPLRLDDGSVPPHHHLEHLRRHFCVLARLCAFLWLCACSIHRRSESTTTSCVCSTHRGLLAIGSYPLRFHFFFFFNAFLFVVCSSSSSSCSSVACVCPRKKMFWVSRSWTSCTTDSYNCVVNRGLQ